MDLEVSGLHLQQELFFLKIHLYSGSSFNDITDLLHIRNSVKQNSIKAAGFEESEEFCCKLLKYL